MSSLQVAKRTASLEAHFMGVVDFDAALRLQRRLVYEASGGRDANVTLLVCEHPPLITVGRGGSRRHIRLSEAELKHRRLSIQFVARGGGCVVHGPGQLCIYPIVSLRARRWTIGEYLSRLQQGLMDTLGDLKIKARPNAQRFGLAGRTGPLVVVGVAVQYDVTLHGAYLNVEMERGASGYVDVISPGETGGGERTVMSSLLSEGGRGVRMAGVRTALVPRLAAAFDCPRHHLHTGHPLLTT